MSRLTPYRVALILVTVFSMSLILSCSEDNPQSPETEQYSFGFSASLTDDGVVLSWNRVNLQGIDGYHLYRSENADAGYMLIETLACDSCDYIDDSVTAAKTYYYYLTLYNASGVDVDTSDVQLVTITGVSIEVSMSSWTASWLGDTSPVITVQSDGNFATSDWSAEEDAYWLTVEPVTGSVPGTFTIITDSNLTASPRFTSVSITVPGLTPVAVPVSQDAALSHLADYETGSYPTSICILDYDLDGDNDLAVANLYASSLTFYENNGSGSFAEGGSLGALHVGDVTAADFDGDGDADLAVAGSDEITLCWNDGVGSFGNPLALSVDSDPDGVCACDLDDDGDMDLVASILAGRVAVFLNNGDGSFATAVTYATASRSRGLCASDMDEDGDLDLAVANDFSDNLSVLIGNGDGTFEPAVNYDVGDYPIAVTSVDIDGDGDQDLIVSNYHAETISILRGNGNATFSAQEVLPVAGGPTQIMAFDIDDDGDLDLCATLIDVYDGYLALMRNEGDGTFAGAINFDLCAGGSAQAADLDGDGDADIAATCAGQDAVSVILNTR